MPKVLVEKPRPHVSVVTLNVPERLNPLSFGLVQALYDALDEVGADNDTWAVVLVGAGRGFCSGMDLEHQGLPPGIDGLPVSRIAIKSMEFMANVVPAMRDLPQPIVAAVNGPAIGGGLCLALGADVRLAAESAYFRAAGITNGLASTELGASWLLPRLVGASRSAEILLTGRDVPAAEAERIGLVSRVVPDERVLEEALDVASRMCELSPLALSMTKRTLWSNLEVGSLAAAIDLENRNQLLVRMTTRNLEEAIQARKEKRKPRYTDE